MIMLSISVAYRRWLCMCSEMTKGTTAVKTLLLTLREL